MISTLTGDNAFALKAKLHDITKSFLEANDELALIRLDGQLAELNDIAEAIASPPFLAERKLVILREPGVSKQFQEATEQLLSDVLETNDVVIVEPKLDKRLSYYKFLKSKTEFLEFKELDSASLANWVVKETKDQGGNISSSDARYLVDRVGLNQQLLSSELNKLLIYEPSISKASIDLLTEASLSSSVFDLLEAAFSGNHQKVIKLYSEQRAQKVEPPQIIALLAWQLQALALIKTAGERTSEDIAREAKLNPFVVRKTQSLGRNRQLAQVKSMTSRLLAIDLRSKNSSIDLEGALQDYLLRLGD